MSPLYERIIGPFFGFLFAFGIYLLGQFISKVRENNKRCHRIINFWSLIKDEFQYNIEKMEQIRDDLAKGILPYYRLKKDVKESTWKEILELQHEKRFLIRDISSAYSKHDMVNNACDVFRQLGFGHKYLANQITNHCNNAVEDDKKILRRIDEAVNEIKYPPVADIIITFIFTAVLGITAYILSPIQDNAAGLLKTVYIAPVNEEISKFCLASAFMFILFPVYLFLLSFIKHSRPNFSLPNIRMKWMKFFQDYFVYLCILSGAYLGYLEYSQEGNLFFNIVTHISFTATGAILIIRYYKKNYQPYMTTSFFFILVSIFLHSIHNQYANNYALGKVLEDVGFSIAYYDTFLILLVLIYLVFPLFRKSFEGLSSKHFH